jgi:hypothetical protein
MTAKPNELAGANHARHALDSFLEATDPILHRMPEGGLAGQFRAAALNLKWQLTAARREMGEGDEELTPLPSGSQTMAAVRPDGLAARVNAELEKGKR